MNITPPHNQKAEQYVLGALIVDAKKIDLLLTKLRTEHFYFEIHQIIYSAIVSLRNKYVTVDAMSLGTELGYHLNIIGGHSYINQLQEACSHHSVNLDHYTEVVINDAELRELQKVFYDNVEKINVGKIKSTEIIGNVSTRILNLSKSNVQEKTEICDLIEDLTKTQEEYAMRSGDDCIGIRTGYTPLDIAMEGYRKENIISILAASSVGKTTFMINLINNLLIQNKRVVVFSLEMSKEELLSKLIALDTGISPSSVIKDLKNNEVYNKQMASKKKYREKRLSIYTELSNYEDIIVAMQYEMMREPVDVFYLDYIQLVRSSKGHKDDTSLVSNAVIAFQASMRKIKSTFVMLSQLSNEMNKSDRTLSVEGKGTGTIKQASNVMIYLKRDGSEEEIMQCLQQEKHLPMTCILTKVRMGSIGSFKLNLIPKTGEFYVPYQ